jgi:hypothetical protein
VLLQKAMNVKLAQKLYPNKITAKIDTVNSPTRKVHDVLYDAFNAWSSLDSFRKLAERNEMYTFGNQWGDRIIDDGKSITEEQLIKNQGNIPLKNNLIRGTIKSVVGIFSSAQTEPVCYARDRDQQNKGEIMSNTLQYNYQLNKLWGLDRLQLMYFMCTGLVNFKSGWGLREGKQDVFTDTPNYNDFFFDNHMKDSRHWDCHLVGEIHELSLNSVMAKFSDGSKEQALKIKSLYNVTETQTIQFLENLTRDYKRHTNFFIPKDYTMCRVIEIWRKESKERYLVKDRLKGELYKVEIEQEKELILENKKRVAEQSSMGVAQENMKLIEYEWILDEYWYYYFLTPTGDVLKEGETPYWHESHPYSFKIYPFYNGRVYPFVSDYIDQQRHINRIIMMQDLISKTSAKGVLMFPEECKPDNLSMDDISEAWAQHDGMIYYKSSPTREVPHQIINNSTDPGLLNMLNIQLKMFQDVSGIQGALQGQQPTAGTPASLFMQQTQNAQTALIDLFESFKEARETRDYKNMKLIQQYYTEDKWINLGGRSSKEIIYKPSEIRNAEMDLSIEESTSTPVYRMIMNDFLMNLMNQQQITLDELLEVGAFPFAEKLRQIISSRKDNAQQAGAGQMIPADMQEQINAGGQGGQM